MMGPMIEAHGTGGAVASPHVLSTSAAIETLARGGSAVDAAIALNAVQGVVAPETCGIGGDLFALVHDGTAVTALNSSGWAGSGASAEALRDAGHADIPRDHPATVTIPGCVAGWFALHERHGRLPMRDLLRRAIELGRDGFPVSTEYARASAMLHRRLSDHAAGAQILQHGEAPARGAIARRPNLADTLERVGDDGRDAFYRGPVAAAISSAVDGLIDPDDLAGFHPEWVEPVSSTVFGATGWTIPPNSQGYLTLATLVLFEQVADGLAPDDPAWTHALVESYRAVASERDDVVADPRHAPIPQESLLDRERLWTLMDGWSPDHAASRTRPSPKPGGTMYACVVDSDGMGVSFIESNFRGIGSAIGAGDAGFVLQDRGGGFDLRPGHPNEIAPGKRPLHTLSPTLWTEGDRLRMVLGTRGGHQQPQVLAQMASWIFGAGFSPGEAQASPRWAIADLSDVAARSTIDVETAMADTIVDGLSARDHAVTRHTSLVGGGGPVSVIDLAADGLRTAAADPRVDTAAAATR